MGEITPIGLNKIKSSLKSSSSRVLEADNDTYNEAEISKRLIELQAQHAGIRNLIATTAMSGEHLAVLVQKFQENARDTLSKVPPLSDIAKQIENMEVEVDSLIADEFEEGGLQLPEGFERE